MKKRNLFITLALVLVLSFTAVPGFAQNWSLDDYDEGPGVSEDDILTYFGTIEDWDSELMDSSGNDIFSELSFEDTSSIEKNFDDQSVEGESVSKSFADGTSSTTTARFIPCGDGRVLIKINLNQLTPITGDPYSTYIRKITFKSALGVDQTLKGCRTQYGANCERVDFDSAGEAVIYGYVETDFVASNTNFAYTLDIRHAQDPRRMASPAANENIITIAGTASPAPGTDMCNANIVQSATPAFTGYYEQCGGKAEFKVAVSNGSSSTSRDIVIPGEVWLNDTSYDNFTCRYTRVSSFGGYDVPNGGDFCEPGEAIIMRPGEVLQFYITIDEMENDMASLSAGTLPVRFRIGTMSTMVTGNLGMRRSGRDKCEAKIVPLDPIEEVFGGDDTVISASGAYSTYSDAMIGMYQKCGRFGTFMVVLKNVGVATGGVQLPPALAVNGMTPLGSYYQSSKPVYGDTIYLAPGEKVTIFGHVYITSMGSALQSDAQMTGIVNFTDLGLNLTGSYYSDRVNWRCTW